jgi:integrase
LAKRRGNNEGTIYKRGNRWCAQVSVNGRRLTKYSDTQTEVREWLKETINQADNGIAVTPQTLGEFLDAWLEAVKPSLRLRTYETYRSNIRHHLRPKLGRIKLRDLRPDHIQRYYADELRAGVGVPTVRLSHAVLHRALAYSVKWNLLARNVVDAVAPPKEETPEMSVWNADQVKCFLRTIQGHRWETLFYLAVTTGMRQGELLGLLWSDLDWDTGQLRIQRQAYRGKLVELKTSSSRRLIALGDVALQKLHERQEHQAHEHEWGSWTEMGLIFTTRTGRPIGVASLYKIFKHFIHRAGLPEIRFHDLRHTAATLMLQRGVHPKIVQERLGHSNISMTLNIYSHALPSLQEDAANDIDNFLRLQ